MTLITQNYFGGIGDHDIYLGKNQISYCSDADISDPAFAALGRKSTNVCTIAGEEIVSYTTHGFVGTRSGKIYDISGNLKYTMPYGPITCMFSISTNLYFTGGGSTGRISVFEYTGDWNTAPSLDNDFFLFGVVNFLREGTGTLVASSDSVRYINSSGAATTLVSQNLSCGIRRRLNNYQQLTTDGKYVYFDGSNTIANAFEDMTGQYKLGFYAEGVQGAITGGLPEYTKVFTLGDQKQLIATARLATPDNKKTFYLGRNHIGFYSDTYMDGEDTCNGINNKIFFIGEAGLTKYGQEKVGLPRAWSIETTKNSLGQVVDQVTAVVTRMQSNGVIRVYYAWKIGANCGLDYIDYTSVPVYTNSGILYSPRYYFGSQKTKVYKFRMRSDTPADTSIKLYISKDMGAFEEFGTFTGTSSKKFDPINFAYEGYDIQFKFELITADSSKTPKLYPFTFETQSIDG